MGREGQENEQPQKEQSSSLQMRFDPGHERREWIVQRFGWVLMILLSLAALAGVLGDGLASRSQAGKIGSDLYVEYDRFIRHQAPFAIKLYCKPGLQKQFSISFDRSFLEQCEIKEIQPAPNSTALSANQCVFHFESSSDQVQLIVWRFEAEAFGKIESQIALNGKTTIKTEQLIWP